MEPTPKIFNDTNQHSDKLTRRNITDHNLINVLSCVFEELYIKQTAWKNFEALSILSMILMSLTIIFNGSILVAMAVSNQYRRTPSHILLLVLGGIDLGTGLTVMPCYVVHLWNISQMQQVHCVLSQFIKFSGYTLTSLTILTILFITVELYLAIVRPFIYEDARNKRYFLIILSLVWSVPLLVMVNCLYIFPHKWRTIKRYVAPSFIVSVYSIICGLHFRIHSEINQLNVQPHQQNTSCRDSLIHKKLFRLTSGILVAFGLCYLPIALLLIYELIFGTSTTIETYVMPWCEFVALSNAVIDPLIYCLRLSFIRRKIFRFICCGKSRKIAMLNRSTNNLKPYGTNCSNDIQRTKVTTNFKVFNIQK